MADLFAQQGITFDSSAVASSHPAGAADSPAAGAPAFPKPGTTLEPQNDNAPLPSDAPRGNPNMTASEKGQAITDIFEPSDQAGGTTSPRDLFADQGILPRADPTAPTISEHNGDALTTGVSMGDPTAEQKPAAEFANNDIARWKVMGQQLGFTPQQLQNFSSQPIGPIEAAAMLSKSEVLPGGGIVRGVSAVKIMSIADKMKNNEEVTQEDQNTFNDFLRDQVEFKMRGFTNGGAATYYGAQLPAFMLEFALSGGLGKLGATAALKGAEEGAATTALNFATRSAITAALMAPSYTARYGERRVTDGMAITDKGDTLGKVSTESPAMSAALAVTHTAADVVSMEALGPVKKYLIDPATKAVTTPLVAAVNDLSPEFRDAVYQAYKKIDPAAMVSKVFTSDGWKNALAAIGVGEVDNIANGLISEATEKNYTAEDLLKQINLNQQSFWVNAGIISVASALHTSFPMVKGLMMSKGVAEPAADEAANNMTALEREEYVNKNLPTPKSEYPQGVADPVARAEQTNSGGIQESTITVYHDHGDTEAQVLQSDMDVREQNDPPPIQEKESVFNNIYSGFKGALKELYTAFSNEDQPIEDLDKEAIANGAEINVPTRLWVNLARYSAGLVKRNWFLHTTEIGDDGNMTITGKSIKSIYDDFDNMFLAHEPDRATRHQDFDDFMIAERLMEEAGSGRDVLVTDEQKTKSVADITRLAEKYGDNFKFFDTFAQEIRDWDNRILHNLVRSGLKSQSWYDELVDERAKYSPLQRLIDKGEFEGNDKEALGIGANPTAKRIGSLKRFKGSALKIRNTLESRLSNSAQIIQKSAVNLVRLKIAKFADYIPSIKISEPAILRKAVERVFDPKLRQKLDLLAKHLGVDIKTDENMSKGTHGSFSNMERLIKLSLGSNDSVRTHELGHALDEHLGLQEKMLSDPSLRVELGKLADDRVNNPITLEDTGERMHFEEEKRKAGKKFLNYIKEPHELIANFFDAYINSPELVNKLAPKAKALFEKIIADNPELSFIKDIRPSTARATEKIQREMIDMEGPRNSLPFYDNGRLKYMQMPKPVYEAFTRMKPVDMSIVEKIYDLMTRPPKALLQFGATHNLDFMGRHFERGTVLAFINSAKGVNPLNLPKQFAQHLGGVAKGVFATMGRTQDYQEWASVGSFESILNTTPEGIKKFREAMFAEGGIKTWIEKVSRVMNLVDQPQRQAVYRKLIAQGYSELEAGAMSRDASGNYGRGGYVSKKINRAAPFFNDMVQGADRFFRSQFGKNAAAFTVAATGTIMLPQLFVTGYYLYVADDKTRREYLNFTPSQRATYMHVNVGGVWQQIPRPFAPGFVYGALPEDIMIHLFGKGAPEPEKFWQSLFGEAASSLSPVTDWSRSLPPLVKSWLEASMNYSLFRQTEIFKGDRETTAPEQQFDAHTSETAKMIGKAFGISPANIDNTVSDMSGRFGRYMTQLSDQAIKATRKAEGQPVAEKPTNPTDNPIYGGMIANDPTGTQTGSYQEFREHRDTATKEHKLLSGMTGGESNAYQEQNHETLNQYSQVHAANSQITKALKEIRVITQNTVMTGDEKAAQIKVINDRILSIAEKSNQQFRQATQH